MVNSKGYLVAMRVPGESTQWCGLDPLPGARGSYNDGPGWWGGSPLPTSGQDPHVTVRATSDGFEVLHRITSRSPDLLFHLRDSLYAALLLRVLAAVESTSTQALIEQAIEMLFHQSRRSG